MSKTLKITLIVAGALLLVGIMTVSLVTAFSGSNFEQLWKNNAFNFPWKINIGTNNVTGYKAWDNTYAADGAYTVSADGLSGIDLKWIAGNATISVYDGAEVVFTETSSQILTQDVALRYGVENGLLFIQYCPTNAPNDLPMKTLDVKIPAALAAEMNTLDFSAASAGLTVSGLTLTDLDCNSVSGRIDASGIVAQKVDFDTTSGDVRFDGNYVRMNVNTVSGMVRINSKGTAQETKVDTTSGAMSFAGNIGVLKANSVSGEVFTDGAVVVHSVDVDTMSGAVSLQLASSPADVNIDTVSGGVQLTLPAGSGFTLQYDTVSGSMNCDFSVVLNGNKFITGDGSGSFDINTVSGGLRIKTAA